MFVAYDGVLVLYGKYETLDTGRVGGVFARYFVFLIRMELGMELVLEASQMWIIFLFYAIAFLAKTFSSSFDKHDILVKCAVTAV